MDFTGYLAPDEFWALMRETDDQLRSSFHAAPVYGLASWAGHAMLGEWAFGEGNRGFQYRDVAEGEPIVVVETGGGSDPRWMLAAFRSRGEFLPHQRGVAASVPDRIVEGDVAGAAVMFEVWDEYGRWWGVGVIGDRAILIESRQAAHLPVALGLVVDVEPFIAGRTDWIRRARGE
ncbi:hypothetical protein IWX81_000501 [Salinibacterium sp. CAN_S4]|uniref:hypothetical protein n=1 Tax=Salinibacterium sp. CAN_S4 TaxID=2787727 RepID=UPI0018EFE4A7